MQALNRLFSILDIVAQNDSRTGPAEVAHEMKLPLSTVSRLMRQLADEDLLYRSPSDGRYTLGSRIFSLAAAAGARADLADIAYPVLKRMRDETDETASLHVLRGSRRVCVAEVQSTLPVRRVVPPGVVQEMCNTATGEVLLAYAADDEVDAAAIRARLSPKERAALEDRLENIRERGYAVRSDPSTELTGISAPLRQGSEVVAALSVSGPAHRFTVDLAEQLAPRMVTAVTRLSTRGSLGAPAAATTK